MTGTKFDATEEIKTIDEDALVGCIMRLAKEKHNLIFDYEQVRVILDAQLEFMTEEGISFTGEVVIK